MTARHVDVGDTPAMLAADAAHEARARTDGAPRRAVVVCDPWLGSNGYAGMKALRRAGLSVQVVAEWEHVPVLWSRPLMRAVARLLRPAAVRELNATLLETVRRARPDLLLVFKGTFVMRATLDAIRALGVRCYCFYPDVSFRAHGPYLPEALPGYDWVFVTKTFGLRDMREQLGVERASVLLHAFDPDLHRPVELSAEDVARYGCDVGFIGTWSPKKAELLSDVVRARPHLSVRIFGNQWDRLEVSHPLAKSCAGFAVEGEEYVRALTAARINLGLLSEQRIGASAGDQVTSRTFHIPACGAFMLHERTEELLQIFTEGRDVACFGSSQELVERIDHYLAHGAERASIASRGRELVRAAHSWDHRVQSILALHQRLSA